MFIRYIWYIEVIHWMICWLLSSIKEHSLDLWPRCFISHSAILLSFQTQRPLPQVVFTHLWIYLIISPFISVSFKTTLLWSILYSDPCMNYMYVFKYLLPSLIIILMALIHTIGCKSNLFVLAVNIFRVLGFFFYPKLGYYLFEVCFILFCSKFAIINGTWLNMFAYTELFLGFT